jgi:hypothetical protein
MRAKYQSRCEECGGTIEPGDEIKKDQSGEIFVHAEECYDAAAESERRFFDLADPGHQYDVRGFGDFDPPEPQDYDYEGGYH